MEYEDILNADMYLLTYPRSGKNWLEWYINKNTNIKLFASHYIKKTKISSPEIFQSKQFDIQRCAEKNINKVFSIVRSPIESIASINVMENFVNENIRFDQYIDHYEFLLNNNILLFSFDALKNNTELIVKTLCDNLNKEFIPNDTNFDNYVKWHIDTQDKRKIVTSKNDEKYLNYLNNIDKNKIKYHNELYDEAKLRCVF